MVSRTYSPTLGSVFDYERSPPKNYFSLDSAIVVLGCMLVVITLASPFGFLADMNRTDNARTALVPTLTEKGYVDFMRHLDGEIKEPVGPIDRFFKIHRDLDSMEQIQDKFLRYVAKGPVHESVPFIQEMTASDTLWKKYAARYGDEKLHDAVDAQAKRNHYSLNLFGEPKNVPAYGWIFAGKMYGLSVLVAMLFFVVGIWREGHKLRRGEWFNVLRYSPIWLYKVWSYPGNIDPVESAKRVLRYAAYTLSTFLSIGSTGAAFAKATSNRDADGTSVLDSANTLVLEEIPVPKVVITIGLETSKVIGNGLEVQHNLVSFQDATASWGSWSFDYWASESIGRAGTSDERDFTVTKVWSLGSTSLTTGLAFYDIQPIASTKGGDILSPFAQLDVPLGHGLTGFVGGSAYHLTGGANGRDGFLTKLGLRESVIKLPLGFDLSGAGSLVYAKGPFHVDEGGLLRGDLTLSHPVFDGRATLGIGVTAFVPVVGARDRKPDHSVQITLSAPLN